VNLSSSAGWENARALGTEDVQKGGNVFKRARTRTKLHCRHDGTREKSPGKTRLGHQRKKSREEQKGGDRENVEQEERKRRSERARCKKKS